MARTGEPAHGHGEWDGLSNKEKNRVLYERQLALLDLFLEKGAITRGQYEKSRHDLTEKMGRSCLERRR